MAQDFTVKVGFDDSSMKKMGREFATIFEGMTRRSATGSKPGMAGGAAESLARMIPGGGFFTNIGKAFAQGGLFVGMAAGITGFVAIGKSLLSSSKVFQTMTGTFFKTVGAMIDMMLAPLMPLFMKFLGWWIREGFKWSRQAGQWLVEWLPRIGNFLATTVEILGGLKTIFNVVKYTLIAWFAFWSIRQGIAAVRGIRRIWRTGGRYGSRFGGGRLGGIGRMGLRGLGMGGGTAGAVMRLGGGIGSGISRLGSGLATRTGARAGLRLGGGFLARRGAGMAAGAGIGALAGAPVGGVGAVPGALIGAVAGLIMMQASGVAIDAATGEKITAKSVMIPFYREGQELEKIMAAGSQEQFSEHQKKTEAMATDQKIEVARALDQNYAAMVGRPDSIVPSTMGTLLGVYENSENRAREIAEKLEQSNPDTDDNWWTEWYNDLKDLWGDAWGGVKRWWNGLNIGFSPGAGTSNPGGQPEKEPPNNDQSTWWVDWYDALKTLWQGAWGGAKRWWNIITGGASENCLPTEVPDGADPPGFFEGIKNSLISLWQNTYTGLVGWYNLLLNREDPLDPDKPPTTDADTEEGGGIIEFFSTTYQNLKDDFKNGANAVIKWWSDLWNNSPKIPSDTESDPPSKDTATILGAYVIGIKNAFASAWNAFSNWWNCLFQNANDEGQPDPTSDPKPASIGSWLKGVVSNIGEAFVDAWCSIRGWWQGLQDAIFGSKPDPDDPDKRSLIQTIGNALNKVYTNALTALENFGNWFITESQNIIGRLPMGGLGSGGFPGRNTGGEMHDSDFAGQRRSRGGWQTGGVVPGPAGMLGLAAVHSGETILPTHLGPGWIDATPGGAAFKRLMSGTASGWGSRGGIGGGMGGGSTTHMTMNRPTIINISTTESTSEVLTSLSQLEMLEDAAFFSSLA